MYLRIEVVEKRSTLTDTVVKNAFVLGDRHLSYANSFRNNRQIRIDQDYSCISCEFSLSAYFCKHVYEKSFHFQIQLNNYSIVHA